MQLQRTISELETKKAELQKTRLNEFLSDFQDKADNTNLNQEVKQEDIISIVSNVVI